VLVELNEENNTFFNTDNELFGEHTSDDLIWINNQTIEYGIYDNTEEITYEFPGGPTSRSVIGKQMVTIPSN